MKRLKPEKHRGHYSLGISLRAVSARGRGEMKSVKLRRARGAIAYQVSKRDDGIARRYLSAGISLLVTYAVGVCQHAVAEGRSSRAECNLGDALCAGRK